MVDSVPSVQRNSPSPLRPRVPGVRYFLGRMIGAVPLVVMSIAFGVAHPAGEMNSEIMSVLLAFLACVVVADAMVYFRRASVLVGDGTLAVRKAWGGKSYSLSRIKLVAVRPVSRDRRHAASCGMIILLEKPFAIERWPLLGFDVDALAGQLASKGIFVDIAEDRWRANDLEREMTRLATARDIRYDTS